MKLVQDGGLPQVRLAGDLVKNLGHRSHLKILGLFFQNALLDHIGVCKCTNNDNEIHYIKLSQIKRYLPKQLNQQLKLSRLNVHRRWFKRTAKAF